VDLQKRRECYQKIENYRKRPLIVYATSTRGGLNAMMAADAIREFVDQINAVSKGDSVDVLINSTGGDPLRAWKLMSLLRERFKMYLFWFPMWHSAQRLSSLSGLMRLLCILMHL
jgi:hypothetical protein